MEISKTKEVKTLLAATYPEYKGRKFRLEAYERPMDLHSYWDEGSRTYYKFVNVDTLQAHELAGNHPFFQPGRPSHLEALPVGIVLVAHDIFMGQDAGITFYVRPDEMPKFIEAPKGA